MTSTRPGAAFVAGTVEVFGHSVGYVTAGEGERVLVMCPGSAGSEPSWAKDLLARHLRVIELNPPGWGGTTPLTHRIDQRDLAVLLAAAIEALGATRYSLHGASMGGTTALWLAAQYPERVLSLSLEGDMNFVREEDLVDPRGIRILADMVARNDPEGTGYPRGVAHPRKPWYDDNYIRGQMLKRIPMMHRTSNRHEHALRQAMAGFRVPTLVLLGDNDELLQLSHLEQWRRLAPQVTTCVVSNGAHDVQNTEPEKLTVLLLEHHAMKDRKSID